MKQLKTIIKREELEEQIKRFYKEEGLLKYNSEITMIPYEKDSKWAYQINIIDKVDGNIKDIRNYDLFEDELPMVLKKRFATETMGIEEAKFNINDGKLEGVEMIFEMPHRRRKENNEEKMLRMKNLKIYKGCLIVVDMVNGFVREGVLHDENISKIIPRQIELIKEARHEGKLIVFIKDTHDKDAVEFERFGNTKHCVEKEFEAELVDELKEFENLEDTVSVPKNSTCFMEAPVFRVLMEKNEELNDFDIVGCCTDICVVNGAIALANYLDQNNRKHNIRVHEDAIATYNEENRKEYVDAAKLLMKQQGINLVKKGR